MSDFAPGELRRSSSRCRPCVRVKNRQNYEKNTVGRRDSSRRYYVDNREAVRDRQKAYRAAHPERHREANRRWREAHPDQLAEYRREFKSVHTYNAWVRRLRLRGLSTDDYWSLLDHQDGGCALCGTTDPGRAGGSMERVFAVDHDHVTGKVRGLLCHHCNRGLGYFRDNSEVMAKAAEYVTMHGVCNVMALSVREARP